MGRSLEPLVGAGVPVGFVVVLSVAVHAVGISRRGDGRLGYDNVVLIPFGPEYPFTNPNHESFLIKAAHIWLLIWFEIMAVDIWLLLWLGYGSEPC